MCKILITLLMFILSENVWAVSLTTDFPGDTSQTTAVTAAISEQINVSVPAVITFNVANVSASTDSANQTVSLTDMVMVNGNGAVVQIKANAASFTPPAGGSVTWAATDISWDYSSTWTNGYLWDSGNLSTSYTYLANSDANVTSMTTNNLKFTLAAKPTVDRAGVHTLSATWKIFTFLP